MFTLTETDYFQDTTFLKSIISSIEEGVIILNDRGRIVSSNKHAAFILNTTQDELMGRSPEDTSTWKAIYLDGSQALNETHPVSVTLQTGKSQNNVILGVEVGNDEIKWLSISSKQVKTNTGENFVYARFADVTKTICINKSLVDEKEKLKESEEKFSKSFHNTAIGMTIVTPEGNLKEVNEAFCLIVGYSRLELLQNSFQQITHPDDLAKDVAFALSLLNKEIDHCQFEKKYIHKNGQIVWAFLSVSLVWNSADEAQFFVSHIQEITELKKLNSRLEERNNELEKTQKALKRKISQLRDFAGIIAHDVRGPAANIKKMLELHESSTDVETRNKAYDLLKKTSNNLTVNLNELIQVLQIHLEKEIPYSDCALQNITDIVLLHFQENIEQSQAQIIFDFQIPILRYPKIYLQSILYNLISNSLKYTRKEVIPVIQISSFAKNNHNYLTVSDNGLGIDLNKFGKSLFQFKKSFHAGYDSKGIGLYLIRNQIEDLGGSIFAESEVDKGTTITVGF